MGARRIGGVFSVKREASVGVRRDTHLLCHWLRLAFSACWLPSSGPAPQGLPLQVHLLVFPPCSFGTYEPGSA